VTKEKSESVLAESPIEKQFWRYWLAGLLLFALMIAMNPSISNGAAPLGISDHQVAGTAAKIDAIQRQWQADGVLWLARLSMAIDLVFIAVYAWGAWCGGKVMRSAAAPAAAKLGLLIMVAAAIFFVADYAETISQFVQVMQFRGSDVLAGIAATAQPVKTLAWITTFIALLAALWFRRNARPKA
jgi:hypothetical protein